METQKMNDKPPNTLFGLSPATYGVASLAAALVALASQLLVVVVGVALAAVVMGLAVLLGVVSGLLGKVFVSSAPITFDTIMRAIQAENKVDFITLPFPWNML